MGCELSYSSIEASATLKYCHNHTCELIKHTFNDFTLYIKQISEYCNSSFSSNEYILANCHKQYFPSSAKIYSSMKLIRLVSKISENQLHYH